MAPDRLTEWLPDHWSHEIIRATPTQLSINGTPWIKVYHAELTRTHDAGMARVTWSRNPLGWPLGHDQRRGYGYLPKRNDHGSAAHPDGFADRSTGRTALALVASGGSSG